MVKYMVNDHVHDLVSDINAEISTITRARAIKFGI